MGQQSQSLAATDHLYVGWDSVQKVPEMISGVSFDLLAGGIPFGATVTGFTAHILEHTRGPSPNEDPRLGRRHNHVNPERAADQGIMACPWPDFLAGAPARPMSEAQEVGPRHCELKILGNRSQTPVNPEAAADQQLFLWSFDLSTIAVNWGKGEENPSISLEPNNDPAKHSSSNWVTSFHGRDIAGPDGGPSAWAIVEWTPPPAPPGSNGVTTVIEESNARVSFAPSGGLVSALAPPSPPVDPPPPTSGSRRAFVRPVSAEIWNIPFVTWLGLLVVLVGIGFVGWLVQGDPTSDREPGAVSVLMQER